MIGHLNIAANLVRTHLESLASRLTGCSHRRTTRPITLPASAWPGVQAKGEVETYVVCLACGRRLPYDWTTMRTSRKRTV